MDWVEKTVIARSPGKEFAVARPSLVLGAYGDHTANDSGAAILDWWLSVIPEAAQLNYLGATSHTFREVTARVLQRLRKQLQKDPDEEHFLVLKDAPEFDCGSYAIELRLGVDPDNDAVNLIYCAFPLTYLDPGGPDRFIELFTRLINTIPLRHATAGFGFNLVWGREYEQGAMPIILATAQRYLGLDVRDRNLELTMSDRVKSAAWLTYLHRDLLGKLGGESKLHETVKTDVTKIQTADGIILRAGAVPPVADKNRGAPDANGLRQINNFIKPLREESWVSANLFRVEESSANKWFSRLDQVE